MVKNKKTKLLFLPKHIRLYVLGLFLLLFLFLGATFLIYAQKPLEVTYPQIPGATPPKTTTTALPDYIRYIFQLSLFIGALITFGSLIYGGVRYLTSAGSPSAQKDAQSQISAGILGLIILFAAYLILNTTSPQLVAFKVSPLEKAPTSRPPAFILKPEVAQLVEIPVGGLIENLWGKREVPKKADCYQFDENGDATGLPTNQDRLDCIKWFSESVQIKAKNLNDPVEELQKLYDCQNCCRDCCKNVCNWAQCSGICELDGVTKIWKNCHSSNPSANSYCQGTKNEGCWENCGVYPSCELKGMVHEYNYQECPANSCEFFQECKCQNCGFESSEIPRTNCICIKKDEEGKPVCCNPDDPTKPYEDPLVEDLIGKIKTALKELRLKLSPFLLTEGLKEEKNLDELLNDETGGAQDLIRRILIGDTNEGNFSTINQDKLKGILGIKSVMKYLIEDYRNLLLDDDNLAKTMMINLGLLENEVAINEIAWMGTAINTPQDEWIELYNNTEGEINLSGWKLVVKNKFEIALSGKIPGAVNPGQGFYLLENNENATSEVADQTYSESLRLADTGEVLELYDQFDNLVDRVYCSDRWFAGDGDSYTSMERINPQEDGSDVDNWATNLSIKVEEEEKKKDFINGNDANGNPIYGTPKNPNSVGLNVISYPSLDALKGKVGERLSKEESQREKLILVLRQEGNLERMLKSQDTKDALANILTGTDKSLKKLLSQGDVIRILLEDKTKSDLLFAGGDANEHIKEVIKDILIDREWKDEDEQKDEYEWDNFIANLPEARTNLKLINDFQEDLLWVSEAGDLMWGCEVDPTSYDQLRVPELFGPKKVQEVPEWSGIKKEIPQIEDLDPSIFYCQKLLW